MLSSTYRSDEGLSEPHDQWQHSRTHTHGASKQTDNSFICVLSKHICLLLRIHPSHRLTPPPKKHACWWTSSPNLVFGYDVDTLCISCRESFRSNIWIMWPYFASQKSLTMPRFVNANKIQPTCSISCDVGGVNEHSATVWTEPPKRTKRSKA